MKNFKKVVAAGLALLMLALSVNVSFAAENYTEKEAVVVAKVNAAGIMTGTDKGFEKDKTLTRAEAAAIMVRMKGISEATVKQNAGTTLFTDVAASHWAAGYINVASNYGIIKGVGAGKFAPEKEVTVAEFYTMAIRSLNAGAVAEAEGTWPTNYVNFAIENKLAEDVAQIYTASATRMSAATIVANTLVANMWKKGAVKNGEVTWEEDDTKHILTTVLGITEYPNVTISLVKTKDRKATFSGINSGNSTKVGDNANLASVKLGQTYTVWYDADEKEVLGFWIPDENDQINFTEIKELNTTKNTIKLKVDGEEVKYDLESADFYFNGKADDSATKTKAAKLPVFGLAYAEDGDIVSVYGESYEHFGIVKEVKNEKIYFESEDLKGMTTLFNKSTLTLDLDKDSDKVYKVTKDGKEIDVLDLEAGDALYWYVKDDEYTMEVVNDTVEGKVVAATAKKIEVDGKEYDMYQDSLATVKDEGTFYLYNGKVTMWHKDKEDKGNFAIIGAARVVNGSSVGKYNYEVKLVSLDGTVSDWTVVDLKETNKKLFGTDEDSYYTVYEYDEDDNPDANDINRDSRFAKGQIVTYTTKSEKVVFTKDIDAKLFYGYVDATKDYISFDNDGTTVAAIKANEKAFITGSTVVVELVSDDDEITLRILDAADIDTVLTKSAGTAIGSAADFDENEVGVVVFKEDASEVKTDNTWAYVKEVVPCTRDDNEDIAYKLTVLYAGAKSDDDKTYLYAKTTITGEEAITSTTDVEDLVGYVVNIAETDNVITKVTAKDLTAKNDFKYLYKDYSDNMKDFANTEFTKVGEETAKSLKVTESDYFEVAEDVIVVKLNNKTAADVTKREAGVIDDIDALTQEHGDDTDVESDVDEIINYWLEKVDDEYVVVAITYFDNEKAN